MERGDSGRREQHHRFGMIYSVERLKKQSGVSDPSPSSTPTAGGGSMMMVRMILGPTECACGGDLQKHVPASSSNQRAACN